MEPTARNDVDIILVHGLFIGPWAWTRVAAALAQRYTVHTPELPFVSLEQDATVVRDLVAALNAEHRTVLLVGHSYGGMVISAAGHEADQLCFLAALVPEPGQTAGDVSSRCVSEICARAMVLSPDGSTIGLAAGSSVAGLYHLCSAEDVAFARDRHRPAPASIFAETVDRPAWKQRPATYIVCSEDQALDPGYQLECGRRFGSYTTVAGDHSAFFSADDQLVQAIVRVAQAMAR